MRVVVAMSGGVDSSVAAALLREQGHDVIGLSMQLYDQSQGQSEGQSQGPSDDPRTEGRQSFGSCCSLDDLHDARRVAASLNIPHYIINFEEQFRATVVQNFVDEYTAGRTPIPCVHCNAELKFAHLVDRAAAFEAAAVATGHYARVVFDEDSRQYQLLRAVDGDKDQSYFLFSLTQTQLAQAMFPVGHLTKPEVRRHAERLGLLVADKPDSYEICFIPDGATGDFVERHMPAHETGEIVTAGGEVLGRHGGIHRFTVGQRKGLTISSPAPLYVLRLDPADRRVVVGPREALGRTDFEARQVNWISGAAPAVPIRATARIRHRHTDAPATITPTGPDAVSVRFDTPQSAVTPGQAAVFYDGERVLGGGWIAR